MELLIPGLILVGLMIYASTRIKRIAAEAFEAETIETDEFTLDKPEGFLNVLNGDPAYAFEAYSKDFGTGDYTDVRAAYAKIRVIDGTDLDSAVENLKKTVSNVSSEMGELIGDAKCRLIDAETEEKGKNLAARFKLISNGQKTYEMQVLSLKETSDEMARKIDRMLDSFTLK